MLPASLTNEQMTELVGQYGDEMLRLALLYLGSREQAEDSLCPEIVVTMRDGTVYDDYSGVSFMVTLGTDGKEDQVLLKSFFAEPIDTSAVAEISINGQRIWQAA